MCTLCSYLVIQERVVAYFKAKETFDLNQPPQGVLKCKSHDGIEKARECCKVARMVVRDINPHKHDPYSALSRNFQRLAQLQKQEGPVPILVRGNWGNIKSVTSNQTSRLITEAQTLSSIA
jgi:hypothetical protein